jgi:hypothetical protein
MKIILACALAVAVASAYYLARSNATDIKSNLTTYYAPQPAVAPVPE